MPREDFYLELDSSVDEVFDEVPGGNSFLALRKLRWSPSSDFRLDIRKWFTNSEGKEIAGKGVSFLTEEGPDNLIESLMKLGYGNTRKTINGIKDRDDFIPAAIEALVAKDAIDAKYLDDIRKETGAAEYYDPKDILVGDE